MTLRTLSKLGLAAVALLGATAAKATPVSFNFDSFSNRTMITAKFNNKVQNLHVGTINLSLYSDNNPATARQTVAFCAEIAQSITVGSEYDNYNTSTLQQADIALSDAQALNVAILYDMYYKGDNVSDWTTKEATAFQIALWELTHDEFDKNSNAGSLSKGNFQVSINDQTTNQEAGDYNTIRNYVNEAKNYLNAVNSELQNGNRYPYDEVVALTSMRNQDLIVGGNSIPQGGGGVVAVPFGVNPLPGLALIGFFGWRRLRKRMNTSANDPAQNA